MTNRSRTFCSPAKSWILQTVESSAQQPEQYKLSSQRHFWRVRRLMLLQVWDGWSWRGSSETSKPAHFGHEGSIKEVSVAQSCLTLCNPMDCSLPGSSVHGILQAMEWVAIPFSRGSSPPRDRTCVSCIEGSFFTRRTELETEISHEISICCCSIPCSSHATSCSSPSSSVPGHPVTAHLASPRLSCFAKTRQGTGAGSCWHCVSP